MKVFVVYCHPSKESFTNRVKEEFIRGLVETGHLYESEAMRTVMLGDRIRDRARNKEMVILDETSHWDEESRTKKCKEHIQSAFELGLNF